MNIITKLFFSFIKVGLFSVGGGYAAIPLIKNQVTDINGLLTLEEFTDLITIAEMTPGPISINSATFVGTRLSGVQGAVICTLGVIIPSFFICLLLAHLYCKYKNLNGLQLVLAALRPAVVALIASAGLSILLLAIFDGKPSEMNILSIKKIEVFLFIGGLYLLRKYKINVIAIIFGTGIAGTLLYSVI